MTVANLATTTLQAVRLENDAAVPEDVAKQAGGPRRTHPVCSVPSAFQLGNSLVANVDRVTLVHDKIQRDEAVDGTVALALEL